MKGQIKTGTYVGNGAAQNIQIGFVPDFLLLVNQTDGDIVTLWFNGFPAATSVDITTAAATQATNSISVYNGTPGGNGAGFVAGSNASKNGKTFYYLAVANQ